MRDNMPSSLGLFRTRSERAEPGSVATAEDSLTSDKMESQLVKMVWYWGYVSATIPPSFPQRVKDAKKVTLIHST
jgi:hypothetical protein